LEEGADWMKSHVDERRVVYVHCKSGIGRSASVVAAYLMKHRRMTAESAVQLLRTQRREIFLPVSPQMTNLIQYEEIIRVEQKFSVQP
jgi:protein-tyrosine phosphatase